jgi:hypothetical protein
VKSYAGSLYTIVETIIEPDLKDWIVILPVSKPEILAIASIICITLRNAFA